MIDERNASELGAEYAPRVENQMNVKHIAYGMKPQASQASTASLAHLDKINSFSLLAIPKDAHRSLWRFTPLEMTSTRHHPIT